MTDITLSSRFSPMYDRSASPDSPWFATAISGFRKRVSICPQLLNGSRGWSVEVESPAMYNVGTPSAFSTSTLATAPPGQFAVKFDLQDRDRALFLAAGATGDAAIFTQSAEFLHILRKVILRVGSYTNYLVLKLH